MSVRRDERPDPRVERSRMVILEAVVGELADKGYGGVTIESIAARAGVGKSTIYRHWPDKLALIADAFETFHEQMVPDLGDRSGARIRRAAPGHVAEVVVDSTWSRCIPALIEGAERDLARAGVPPPLLRRAPARADRADHAWRRGRRVPLRARPRLATVAMLGTIFYRRLMTGEPFAAGGRGRVGRLDPRPRRLNGDHYRRRRRARHCSDRITQCS